MTQISPATTLNLAETYKQYESATNLYSSIRGVPPGLVVRLDLLTKSGISGEALVEAIRKAGPEKGPFTPGWAETLMEYGQEALDGGYEQLKKSGREKACQEFLKASVWFFLARFPHILSSQAGEAYKKHIASYQKALEYSVYRMEEISIPFEGKNIPAYLRMPKTTTIPPLVVLCGGTDVWKSDLEIHLQSEAFLEQGIATLTIDHPGTGECPALSIPQEEKYFLAVLKHMKKLSQIDASRMAFYGLSFGGKWGIKLSLMAPELKASVNVGGPAHYSFAPEWVAKFPLPLKKALGLIVGVDPVKEPDFFAEALLQRSVERKQDLISAGGQKVPLLCINGENDEVVPIEEFDFLKGMGMKVDTVVFSNDRHVASRNATLRDAFVTQWVVRKLGVL